MTYISPSMQKSRSKGQRKYQERLKAEKLADLAKNRGQDKILRSKPEKRVAGLKRASSAKISPNILTASRPRKKAYGRQEAEKLTKTRVKADLNVIFSAWVRMRDADDRGIVICISSGKPYHWHDVDNGHYLPRSVAPGLIFHETNCNAQSKIDNWLEGNRLEYRKGMIKKYGLTRVELLESMKNKKSGIGLFEMKALVFHYIGKFKEQATRLNHMPNKTQQAILNRWLKIENKTKISKAN